MKKLMVYSYTKPTGISSQVHGQGNAEVEVPYWPITLEEIKDLEVQVKDRCGYDGCVIINFIDLRED